MSNYSLNNVRRKAFLINEDEYWDMHLNEDCLGSYSFSGMEIDEDCLGAYIDTDIEGCVSGRTLNSAVAYSGACSVGLDLKNIGLTGMDNGFIQFQRDRITNSEFYKLYTSSEYILPEDDLLLHLYAVSGNTDLYDYPMSINEDGTIKLNGGFYQGFFRSDDSYGVLPAVIDSEWNFEFELKPEDYEAESDKTLNDKYPENKGTFFYIGTRAENKWIYLYKDLMSGSTSGECVYTEDLFDLVDEDLDLSEVEFETDNGFKLDSPNDGYTISDNKFIIFDRTPSGVTTANYTGDEVARVEYKTKPMSTNLFIYMNRTPSGYTAECADELLSADTAYSYSYDTFYSDLYNNALGFFITDEGAIGYKYVVKDCSGDSVGHYTVEEGQSFDGVIDKSEWNKINVKIKVSELYMKIYFYVNNKLKYVTKQLPKLNLRALDELEEKQEGVAFNISIGGGTQGLAETIMPDYMQNPTQTFVLEKYFGGSFIGDFKSFKFYTC